MKLLIKTILILVAIFTTTLLVIKFSGLLTVEDIKDIFANLKSQPSYVLGALIVFFLFIDLFIDLFIVPIDLTIPGGIGPFINDFLKVFISVILVLVFLYLWDRLATFYYESNRKKRIKNNRLKP